MTSDKDIILKGLHCCSRTNPDCDSCPFATTQVHCRELESDAAKLIIKLDNELSLLQEDILRANDKFSEGDFAEGLKTLILIANHIEQNGK